MAQSPMAVPQPRQRGSLMRFFGFFVVGGGEGEGEREKRERGEEKGERKKKKGREVAVAGKEEEQKNSLSIFYKLEDPKKPYSHQRKDRRVVPVAHPRDAVDPVREGCRVLQEELARGALSEEDLGRVAAAAAAGPVHKVGEAADDPPVGRQREDEPVFWGGWGDEG